MLPRITDDVFLLHLTFKTPQCAFQGFAILYEYVSQVFSPFIPDHLPRLKLLRIRERLLVCQVGRGLAAAP
jgi:hypothetical protein